MEKLDILYKTVKPSYAHIDCTILSNLKKEKSVSISIFVTASILRELIAPINEQSAVLNQAQVKFSSAKDQRKLGKIKYDKPSVN